MIKQILASLGIGSAEVDTKLHNPVVSPGEQLSGEVVIRGGKANQEIDELSLFLMTEVEVEHSDGEFRQPLMISRAPLARSFTIRAGEQLSIPFAIQVHPETPITELPPPRGQQGAGWSSSNSAMGKGSDINGSFGGNGVDSAWSLLPTGARNSTKVWLHTGLDIDNGIDSSDRDILTVRPTAPMLRFMAALEKLGFVLHSADVERGTLRGGGFQSTIGCYQELEYREAYGRNTGIKQLEVSFITRPNDTGVLLEVDSRFRHGDSYRSFLLNHANYQQVDWERELRQALEWSR
jgi:sporulation-control protein